MSIIFPEFSIGLFKIKQLHVIISLGWELKSLWCARKRSKFWHGFGFDETSVILWYNSLEFQSWRHVKMVIFLTKRWKKANQLSVGRCEGKNKYSIRLYCYCGKDSWLWFKRGDFGGIRSSVSHGEVVQGTKHSTSWLGSFLVLPNKFPLEGSPHPASFSYIWNLLLPVLINSM